MRIFTRKTKWKARVKTNQLKTRAHSEKVRHALRNRFLDASKEANLRANVHRLNPTPSERRMMTILNSLPVQYIFEHVHFYDGLKYRIVDFYLPYYKLNIEIDGGYHKDKRIRSYDIYKDFYTKYRTVRFENDELVRPEFIENLKALLIKREIDLYRSSSGFKGGCESEQVQPC